MRLQFRGKTYERPNLDMDVSEGEVGGIYRGTAWKVHYLKEQHHRNQIKSDLTYRGIHYIKD